MTTLEKIREEVCKLYPFYRIDRDYPSGLYDGKCWVLDKVVDVIDKYAEQEPCKVSEYDKDHIWYKGHQYISLRRFLEVKAETEKGGE